MSSTTTKTRTISSLKSTLKLQNILCLVQTSLEDNFKQIAELTDENTANIIKNTETATKNRQDIDFLLSKLTGLQQHNAKLEQQFSDFRTKHSSGKMTNNPQNQTQKQSLNVINSNKQYQKLRQQLSKLQQKNKSQHTDLQNKLKSAQKQILLMKAQLRKQNTDQSGNTGLNLQQLNRKIQSSFLMNKQLQKQIDALMEECRKLAKNGKSGDDGYRLLSDKFEQHMTGYRQFKQQEYAGFKEETNQRILKIQEMLNQTNGSLSEQQRLRTKLAQQVYQISKQIKDGQQAKLETQINSDSIKQLQRQISELFKKLHELQGANKGDSYNNYKNSTLNQTVLDSHDKRNNGSADQNGQNMQKLREQMIERMRDLRQDFIKGIKKLDMRRQQDYDNISKRVDALQQALLRLQHLISDKADIVSVKKMMSFLENKISYIFNTVLGQNNQEDAAIAKKKWLCLSCDKKLDNYQGKIGSHLINSQFKSKLLEQQSMGGGMNLKSTKSKVDLPNVHKITQSQQSEKFIRAKK